MALPEINIGAPRAISEYKPEELPLLYLDIKSKNNLLERIEMQAKSCSWTDLEIRTLQLVIAVYSNASLQQRLMELEQRLGYSDKNMLKNGDF